MDTVVNLDLLIDRQPPAMAANMLKKHSVQQAKSGPLAWELIAYFFSLTSLTGTEKLRVCYMFRPFLRPSSGMYKRNSTLNKPALCWTE